MALRPNQGHRSGQHRSAIRLPLPCLLLANIASNNGNSGSVTRTIGIAPESITEHHLPDLD